MSDFDMHSFIELLIKQTCRRAAYEFELGSGQSTDDPSNVFSLGFLKALHDKPRDNIQKVLKIPNGIQPLNGDFNMVQKKVFVDFLVKVKEMEPPKAIKWIDLLHYMHYVYRNFASPQPNPSAETLSPMFIDEMRSLVRSLLEDDASQLFLRIFGLLREYCIFAHWNYSRICDKEISITKLFYYYEAMLSAAKNLTNVFPEFEIVVYKNYSVCWIDFNTCIFIHYFFETEFVQNRIFEFKENKINPTDTPEMYALLGDLRNLWVNEQKRISELNMEGLGDVNSGHYDVDVAMLAEHRKILSQNFWVERTKEEKDSLDLSRMDHHIFRLLSDQNVNMAGPMLDKNGQCICEECLFSKYKYLLDVEQNDICSETMLSSPRLLCCIQCEHLIDLGLFHRHIISNSHAMPELDRTPRLNGTTHLSNIISQKMDTTNLNSPSKSPPTLSEILRIEEAAEKLYISQPNKEPLPKIASEPPVFNSTCDISSITNDDIAYTKLAFEEFLKDRNYSLPDGGDSASDKIKIKKDIFTSVNGSFGVDNKPKEPICPVKKIEEPKVRDLGKTTQKPPSNPAPPPFTNKQTIKENPCGHSCKHDDDLRAELKKGCQNHGMCDHHKESKKCDCTYCEVFGTSVTSHTHKSNELRDRLRIRLHQRREKRTKDAFTKHPPTATTAATSSSTNNANPKVKPGVNKIEERVPPPTPHAPAPPTATKTADKTSMINDIHGLLNYIEGNTSLDKMALAQKKAAKKARQRVKKEEERLKIEMEEKRKKEEERRKEEERKRAEELARQLAEKARIKSAPNQGSKKKGKNKNNKNNSNNNAVTSTSANKKPVEKKKEDMLEETIPAMVTIKRVAEKGNCPPTVTITLKGSTPDQDKLLYTLVNGADKKNNDAAIETSNNNNKKNKNQKSDVSSKNNNGKNKKNKSQSDKSNTHNNASTAIFTKELKVTLAVDPSVNNSSSNDSKKGNKLNSKVADKKSEKQKQEVKKEKKTKSEDINLPMLRLPPGITITKVEGPVSNRNYKASNLQDQPPGSTINVNKSGVIVVDTEKLIKQTNNTPNSKDQSETKTSKKNRKKNKKLAESQNAAASIQNKQQMITLKNPIFQTLQNNKPETPVDKSNNDNQCAPAAIFTSANGMVTIRSSRLQQSLANGGGGSSNSMPMPMPNLLSDLKPVVGPEVPPYMPAYSIPETKRLSSFNAQEILSGLPGIEITKVDKRAVKPEVDPKSCQTAQVSIIPANNNGEKFNMDKEDWTFDSVFTPKDILEDDMDADERELEAFKRFCQQSVPPKRKEKVAHLNVKDIIFKKKNDANCV